MRAIPEPLRRAFCEELRKRGFPERRQREWQKWLRYYLDFCGKYRHPPREEDSAQPFLQKLASKRQSATQQAEAAQSVGLFYEVVRRFPPPEERSGASREAVTSWKKCFEEMKGVMKVRHYSPKTLKSYMGWVRDFRRYLGSKDPAELGMDDVERYLTYLATERQVVASTQNQAFNALLFLFKHVLERPFEVGKKVVRARRRRHVPVVLSRGEVDRVVAEIPPPYDLLALVLYGCGLRLAEGLNLRIQCFNFEAGIVTVHDGKGAKDRTVPLPKVLAPRLLEHREGVRRLYEEDSATEDFGGAFMPQGSERKWNPRAREWIWQYFFPAKSLTFVPEEKKRRRYHLHETDFGRELRQAARKAQLDKRVTAHTFRHAYS